MTSIDFKKYKRFFAFGCSFTNHVYPTWANVVCSEMPDVEFYNFGLSGSGNTLINVRLSEANARFNFCETDLIMVMYTTFYREDRWVRGQWLNAGNVYNNHIYDKSFLKKYADTTGYAIRDLALINSTHGYIKSLPCDSFFMMSSDWTHEIDISILADDISYPKIKDVLEIYGSMLEKNFPVPMFTKSSKYFTGKTIKYRRHDGSIWNDCHPDPQTYMEYLKEIGLPLTNKSEEYVKYCMESIAKSSSQSDFEKYFSYEEESRVKGLSGIMLF